MGKGLDFYQTVERLMKEGRMDEARHHFADDFVLYEDPSLPYGGVHRGFDAFLGVMGEIVEVWKGTDFFSVREYMENADGTYVSAIMDIEGRPGKSNRVIKSVISEVYRLRDGKAVECRLWYFGAEDIARAIRGEN